MLRGLHRPIRPVLPHPDARLRGGGARYLRGLAQAEDCTFASMAAVVDEGCAQQFQHFISNSPWDHEAVVAQIGQDADRLLGGKPTSA